MLNPPRISRLWLVSLTLSALLLRSLLGRDSKDAEPREPPRPDTPEDQSTRLGAARKAILDLLIISVILFGCGIFIAELLGTGIVIEPYNVPPALSDQGVDGSAVAHLLADRLREIQENATTRRKSQNVLGPGNFDLGRVEISGAQISFRSLLGLVREKIGLRTTAVSGNILLDDTEFVVMTRRGEGPIVRLTKERGENDLQALESLISESAESLLVDLDPFLLASFYYATYDRRVFEAIETCVANCEPEDRLFSRNLRALLALDNDRLSLAEEELLKLISDTPKFQPPYVNLTVVMLSDPRSDRRKEAEALLRRIPEKRRSFPVLCRLAYVVGQDGRYDEAEELLEEAEELEPRAAEPDYIRAQLRRDRGDWQETVELLTEVIDKAPERTYALRTLVEVLETHGTELQAGRWLYIYRDRVREHFEHTLRVNPRSSGAMVAFAEVLFDWSEIESAQDWLRKAIANDPGDALAYQRLARIHLRYREFFEAEKLLRTALDLDPVFLDAWVDLAACRMGVEDYADASRIYSQIERRFGKQPVVSIGRADSLAREGKRSEALAVLTEASVMWPEVEEIQRMRARVEGEMR